MSGEPWVDAVIVVSAVIVVLFGAGLLFGGRSK